MSRPGTVRSIGGSPIQRDEAYSRRNPGPMMEARSGSVRARRSRADGWEPTVSKLGAPCEVQSISRGEALERITIVGEL